MSQHHNHQFDPKFRRFHGFFRVYNLILFLFRPIRIALKRMTRGIMRSLLRGWVKLNRNDRYSRAGFVLPTVTMVLLVVVLLTLAISLRSMDRAKIAQYSRVNQAVLNAASPALDRAKAKISYLFSGDPTLPRATPSDPELDRAMGENRYTFDDEIRLQVRSDINGDQKIDNGKTLEDSYELPIEDRERITTAWKFPVDTDNNGVYDSWTLYGVYMRSPSRDAATGKFNRVRNPLEARSAPRPPVETFKPGCESLGVSASLVGDSGWFSSGSQLRKSVFVYVANTPIRNPLTAQETAIVNTNYETKSTTAVSTLEYQQDIIRLPLNNNAVVYRDDLAISAGTAFRLNGRVITNSNLLITQFQATPAAPLEFRLVSAPASCFYSPAENSKILVAGNVVHGTVVDNANRAAANAVRVDLYQGAKANPLTTQKISSTNQSVTEPPLSVLYNTEAYENRLSKLVALAKGQTSVTQSNLFKDLSGTALDNALRTYFEDRTRRVPYAQINYGETDLDTPQIVGSIADNNLRPADTWIYPTNIEGSGETGLTGIATKPFTNLTLGAGNNYQPLASQAPEVIASKDPEVEAQIGDRVLIGNNLPAKWFIKSKEVSGSTEQKIKGVFWGNNTSNGQRTRQSRVQQLPDVGSGSRDGFWEHVAGIEPTTPFDNYGGLRVITSAGVYDRSQSFLPPPKLDVDSATSPTKVVEGTYLKDGKQRTIVWPDTMPMSPVPPTTEPNPSDGSMLYNNDPDLKDKTTNQEIPQGDKRRWVKNKEWANNPNGWAGTVPPAPQKGDLQMRATAVYHYAPAAENRFSKTDYDNKEWSKIKQTPIACVSSYYDPSTSLTAKNAEDLPDWAGVTGGNKAAGGRSNNGIVYGKPPSADWDKLNKQAYLVFPDGRWVNPILKSAADKNGSNLTLSEQAAVDSTMCAIGIAEQTLSVATTIPHGAIYETAFLDARQIKAIDADNFTTTSVDETFTLTNEAGTQGNLTKNYDLPLENRQPLEIRATVLDLNQLRQTKVDQTSKGPSSSTDIDNLSSGKEYLLPYSGIVYASRDDALPDLSQPNDTKVSAADSKLDPSRRPNGIMLINGTCLARGTSGCQNTASGVKLENIIKEKGLTLASNLPVYIKGQFNPHSQEEFRALETLKSDWSNFYDFTNSSQLNPDFACRVGDPRLNQKCPTGDDWRSATVISDSVTLLSGADAQNGFRFGFRNEGDFDLRNNAGVARVGYDLDGNGSIGVPKPASGTNPAININQAVTEDQFGFDLDGDGYSATDSVREWEVTAKAARMINGFDPYNNFGTNGLSSGAKFDTNNDGIAETPYQDSTYTATGGLNSSYFNNFVTPIQRRTQFPDYPMEMCRKPMISACGPRDWFVGFDFSDLTYKIGDITGINNKDIEFSYSTPYPPYVDATGKLTVKPKDIDVYQLMVLLPAGRATIDGKNFQLNFYDSTSLSSDFKESPISLPARLYSGTTSRPPGGEYETDVSILQGLQRFPRRVAFLRDHNGKVLAKGGHPAIVGLSPKTPGKSETAIPQDEQHDTLDCFVPGEKITLDEETVNVNVPTKKDKQNNNNNANPTLQSCGSYTDRGPRIRSVANALWFRTNDTAKTTTATKINYGYSFPLWIYNPPTTSTTPLPTAPKSFPQNPPPSPNPNPSPSLSIQHPLLVPVLQLDATTKGSLQNDPLDKTKKILVPTLTQTELNTGNTNADGGTSWLMIADNGNSGTTAYDFVMATGDVPSRRVGANTGDFNGGLPNLPRLLENWLGKTVKISGSFMQIQRSEYGTAPYFAALPNAADPADTPAIFGAGANIYKTASTSGRTPYFSQPTRNWGFDVGLLSQSPDLFAQRFTSNNSDAKVDQFYRELGRNDEWVQTLMCAMEMKIDSTTQKPTSTDDKAVKDPERPSTCIN